MKNDVSRFFRSIGCQCTASDADYEKAAMCVSAVDAMARCSNCSLYVIDYNRKNFLYVSSNPLFLCGYSPEEVKAKGYEFYFDVVPEDEIGMLLEINDAGFGFYNSVQADRRLDCIIEYDFHIGLPHGRMRLIHHKLSPLLLSRGGGICGLRYVPCRYRVARMPVML